MYPKEAHNFNRLASTRGGTVFSGLISLSRGLDPGLNIRRISYKINPVFRDVLSGA